VIALASTFAAIAASLLVNPALRDLGPPERDGVGISGSEATELRNDVS
jgi:hypothetical protein